MKLYLSTLALLCAQAQSVAQMPSAEALEKETQRQLGLANDAIKKASTQTGFAPPQVPKIDAPVSSAKAVDPAEIAARYKLLNKPSDADLYVLISFSMPNQSIESVATLATTAGATLVLSGLHNDSLQDTMQLVAAFVKKHPALKVTIDPTLFRKYTVATVPTFILAKPSVDQSTCSKGCAAEDQFASVSGDVTLDYALDYIAAKASPDIASYAKSYLAKIRRTQ